MINASLSCILNKMTIEGRRFSLIYRTAPYSYAPEGIQCDKAYIKLSNGESMLNKLKIKNCK